MQKEIKYGVIGAGHLGNYHIEQIKKVEKTGLVGVYDTNIQAARLAREKHNVLIYENLDSLLLQCDAVSIATPTFSHYDVAKKAIKNNCHIFIEKPITKKISHAEEIIALAHSNNLKLQVGHIERFNPAYKKFTEKKRNPVFIEAHRLAPYNIRGTDVPVVLDLMIHDIDLVLNLINNDIIEIQANGAAVISGFVDLANARITFKNGAVANLTASRISDKQMRHIRVFENNSYSAIDLHNHSIKQYAINNKKEIVPRAITIKPSNALFGELQSFVHSIRTGSNTSVSGCDALQALKIAIKIQNLIEKQKIN